MQDMSCEGACAHAHVGCAVARVRAKSILTSVRDVRVCGPFFGRAMCDHTFEHFLGQTCQKMLLFVLKTIL